jgi:hypothetical protein
MALVWPSICSLNLKRVALLPDCGGSPGWDVAELLLHTHLLCELLLFQALCMLKLLDTAYCGRQVSSLLFYQYLVPLPFLQEGPDGANCSNVLSQIFCFSCTSITLLQHCSWVKGFLTWSYHMNPLGEIFLWHRKPYAELFKKSRRIKLGVWKI